MKIQTRAPKIARRWCGASAWVLPGLAALFMAGVFWSCSHVSAPDGNEGGFIVTDFTITVDSLRTSSPVVLGDSLRAWLWGIVGTDACHSFGRIAAWHESEQRVHLVAMGVLATPMGGSCPDTLVYMDWEEYSYLPSQQGEVLIIAENPDGSVLVDTVDVIAVDRQARGPRPN